MENSLYWNTVSPLLRSVLEQLMACTLFDTFRLVGGTALSLQHGHRVSVDIDLFTDSEYDSVDFDAIDSYLRAAFQYVSPSGPGGVAMGVSYFLGNGREDCIKLDLYYTDEFIQQMETVDGIRMATTEEIIAMKIDVVQRGGRKKDFWDIHELLSDYTPQQMIALHERRYPYSHDKSMIVANFTDFINADDDFEPVCLRGKYWEIIKAEIVQAIEG